MFNKYLIVLSVSLSLGCVLLYNLWEDTKTELNSVKAQKITLEQELKRRDENEKNLSKRIRELSDLYASNPDYFNTAVPSELVGRLSKSCKACK